MSTKLTHTRQGWYKSMYVFLDLVTMMNLLTEIAAWLYRVTVRITRVVYPITAHPSGSIRLFWFLQMVTTKKGVAIADRNKFATDKLVTYTFGTVLICLDIVTVMIVSRLPNIPHSIAVDNSTVSNTVNHSSVPPVWFPLATPSMFFHAPTRKGSKNKSHTQNFWVLLLFQTQNFTCFLFLYVSIFRTYFWLLALVSLLFPKVCTVSEMQKEKKNVLWSLDHLEYTSV